MPTSPAHRACALVLSTLVLGACSVAPPRHTVSNRPGGGASGDAAVAHADGTSHTVVRGDTLYSIAFRNQLDFHDLADWNQIGRDYAIRPGQILRLTPPDSSGSPRMASRDPAPTASTPRPPRIATAAAVPPVSPQAPQAPASPRNGPPAPVSPGPASRHGDDGGWEWPTRGKVVRGFGDEGSTKGLDIAGERGQVVVASRAGKVVYSGTALKGYGELIIVKHDEQFLSAYGYNRRRLVEEGETVVAGQPIAEMGDGPEQRPLLHYEIREKGRPIDPAALLPAR